MKPWKFGTAMFGLALAGLALTTLAAESRPDLTGTVTEADGAPLAKASVFIYTAGPKQGTSMLCPSCYADCRKSAQTDTAGQFKIESLDPALVFRLLITAPGHETRFVSKVDPQKGAQKITLKVLSEAALNSPLRIKGMVVDEHGKPVPGALVNPEGVGMGEMTRWGGNDSVVEPVAVADENGRFVLFCKTNAVDTVHTTVEGRGVAKQWVIFKPGGDYFVRLPEGVTVKGRIVRDGQPLKGISVATTTTDRVCGSYLDCDPISTDDQGRFTLFNVPPKREMICYVTMGSLKSLGAVPSKVITTGGSGTTDDLGQLEVKPAYRVAGRVVLSDGKSVPSGTRVFLARDSLMDSLETNLDAEGRFEFKGVPAEGVTVVVRIKGYKLSKRNPSLDWMNGQIVGRVPADVADLNILLEPGEWKYNQETERPDGGDARPTEKPLRGVKL